MQVVAIYSAFQGEVNKYGIGAKCTFLRLAGCNLRCYQSTGGCDTPEGLSTEFKKEREKSFLHISLELKKLGNDLICLTGGEPLLHDVKGLIEYLHESNKDYKFSIETNGTIPLVDFEEKYNVSYVVDYKVPSTEVKELFVPSILPILNRDKGYIKFVIDSPYDLNEFTKVYQSLLRYFPNINVGVGLKWGAKLNYRQLSQFLIEFKMPNISLNIQAHKLEVMYDELGSEIKNIKFPQNV